MAKQLEDEAGEIATTRRRRLGDVFHHEETGHEPIPPNA
jgi:hypothetical protein